MLANHHFSAEYLIRGLSIHPAIMVRAEDATLAPRLHKPVLPAIAETLCSAVLSGGHMPSSPFESRTESACLKAGRADHHDLGSCKTSELSGTVDLPYLVRYRRFYKPALTNNKSTLRTSRTDMSGYAYVTHPAADPVPG